MYVHEQILAEKSLQEKDLPLSIKSEIGRFRVKQKSGAKEDELFRHSEKIAVLIQDHALKMEEEVRKKQEAEAAEKQKKEQEERERMEAEQKKKQEEMAKAIPPLRCKELLAQMPTPVPIEIRRKIQAVDMMVNRYKKNPTESILNALKNSDNTACTAIETELNKKTEMENEEKQKKEAEAQAAAKAAQEAAEKKASEAAQQAAAAQTPEPPKSKTGNSILDMLYGMK